KAVSNLRCIERPDDRVQPRAGRLRETLGFLLVLATRSAGRVNSEVPDKVIQPVGKNFREHIFAGSERLTECEAVDGGCDFPTLTGNAVGRARDSLAKRAADGGGLPAVMDHLGAEQFDLGAGLAGSAAFEDGRDAVWIGRWLAKVKLQGAGGQPQGGVGTR